MTERLRRHRRTKTPTTPRALRRSACQVAQTIGAQAIVAFTKSGSTALRVAREKPGCPVIGLTADMETARRLAAVWGVRASVTVEVHSMSEATARAVKISRLEGFTTKGDEIVVVTDVPFGQPGTTNASRVAQV
jgi:pyruvate kinase